MIYFNSNGFKTFKSNFNIYSEYSLYHKAVWSYEPMYRFFYD